MKFNNTKFTSLLAGTLLSICSLGAYAVETHMSQALKHAEEANIASDTKAITEHAEAAKGQATIIEEHLKAGITSLDATIEHGKQGHADLAKKSAQEAVTHLKAAQ